MGYRSFAEIERDNQDIYEEGLAYESERLSKLVNKEIEVIKREGDGYGESEEVTFIYRNHEYSIEFIYGMPAGYNDRLFVELIEEIDKELEEEKQSFDRVIEKKLAILDRLQMILGAETIDDLPDLALKIDNKCYSACYELEQAKSKLKALDIIRETPIFAWYITIYKDAYEMVSDVKGFRVNNSVEELQEMFDLLKEVLG